MGADTTYIRKVDSLAQNPSNKRIRSGTGFTEDDTKDNMSALDMPRKPPVSIVSFRVLTFEMY
jgi:hypothetical protein